MRRFILFKYTIFLSAIFIAACAAWFSVTGISNLFVGEHIPTMIMALSLEAGKLTVASFIYRYWRDIHKFLKYYMVVGAVVLSGITSTGIYGYLHAAYSSASLGISEAQSQISVMEAQQSSLDTLINQNNQQIRNIQFDRRQQEQRLNSLVGKVGFLTQQVIVRESQIEMRRLQNENVKFTLQKDSLNTKKILLMNSAVAGNTKIGTFWYVSKALGVPLDKLVNWFVLAIVLVFDPLAIALVLAYNFMIKRERLEEKPPMPIKPITSDKPTTLVAEIKDQGSVESAGTDPVSELINSPLSPRAAAPYEGIS